MAVENARTSVATRLRFDRAVPRAQAVWFLKTRALTEKMWVDDTELEEEGVAEVLLDDNAMAQAPRCVLPRLPRLRRCRHPPHLAPFFRHSLAGRERL